MSETICARAAALENVMWDGGLDDDRWTELRAHAAVCATCADVMRGVSETREALERYRSEESDAPDVEDAWRVVSTKLDATGRGRWKLVSVALGMAATAAIIIRVGIGFGESLRMESAPMPVEGSGVRSRTQSLPAATESFEVPSYDHLRVAEQVEEEHLNGRGFRPGAEPQAVSTSVATKVDAAAAPIALAPPTPRVERSAILTLRVADARGEVKSVTAMVTDLGGRIVRAHVNQPAADAPAEAAMTLKVPAQHFDAVIAKLHAAGTILSENIAGEDRTEEYSDVEARIADKAAAIEKLRQHLVSDRLTAEEVARCEGELARLRDEHDRLETSRRDIAAKTDFATVELTLTEKKDQARGGMTPIELFTDRFNASFGTAAALFSWGVAAIMVIAGAALPWAVILTPAWWLLRRRIFAW